MLKPVLPLTEVDDFGDGKKDLLPLVLLFFGVFLYFSRRSFEASGVTGSDFRLLGLKSLRICSITLLASRLSFAKMRFISSSRSGSSASRAFKV